MVVSRRALLTSLFTAGAAGGALAQDVFKQPLPGSPLQPRVLSGSDIGFRVDRDGPGGTKVGTLVVRVDDEWVETTFSAGLRRMTSSR
jgi:hypothetical protein